jgi:hypothetical protein
VLFEKKHTKSFYLQFGSDILLFMLHSNVFAFNRDHEVIENGLLLKKIKTGFNCGQISITIS